MYRLHALCTTGKDFCLYAVVLRRRRRAGRLDFIHYWQGILPADCLHALLARISACSPAAPRRKTWLSYTTGKEFCQLIKVITYSARWLSTLPASTGQEEGRKWKKIPLSHSWIMGRIYVTKPMSDSWGMGLICATYPMSRLWEWIMSSSSNVNSPKT